MISYDKIKEILEPILRERSEVIVAYLYGSFLDSSNYNDIDIGVKGIDPKLFFKFYAELYKNLPVPVDLIDMSKKSSFTEYIEKTGKKIYG